MIEVVVGAVDAIGSAAEAVTRADVTSRHDAFVEQQLLRVEARNRALVFVQQLTVYVEILYCIIRNNLKNELGSLPTLCTQVIILQGILKIILTFFIDFSYYV